MAKKAKSDISTLVLASAPNGSTYDPAMAMDRILADHAWNSRSGEWMLDEGDTEESEGFKGLVTSIADRGLDTPITIRRNPSKKGREFAVVCGFRRYMATLEVAKLRGDKAPTIQVFILPENTTEAQARALNGRENILRDNLRASDTAFLTKELSNTGMTQAAIGSEIGKKQTYVGKLLAIMSMDSKVTEHWRKNTVNPVPVMTLSKLGFKAAKENMTPEAQWEAYIALAEPTTSAGGSPLQRACDAAKKAGAMLGALHRASYIDCSDFDFESAVSEGHIVKFKDDSSPEDLLTIEEACRLGFEEATNPPAKAPKAETLKGADAVKPTGKTGSKAVKADKAGK